MSPFSPRPWFFLPPRLIRPSNYHLPLATRCLHHGATSYPSTSLPSTSLTTCQRLSRSFITIPRRSSRTVEKARSRISSGVSLTHLCSFNCSTDSSTNPVFFRVAVLYRCGSRLPVCLRRRYLILPIRKSPPGAPACSGGGKRGG